MQILVWVGLLILAVATGGLIGLIIIACFFLAIFIALFSSVVKFVLWFKRELNFCIYKIWYRRRGK